MNLPITWDELDTLPWDAYDVDNAHERLTKGDILAAEIGRIGSQRFAPLVERAIAAAYEFEPIPESPQPRSEVITIALAILADGKPRLVEEIEEEAIARDLWPKNERRKYVYATLKAYIEKSIARNEKPLIVQDPDRRFRLNHPADDLPDPGPETPWQAPQKLINALVTTSAGVDPTAFELAVCNAFEALGFKSTHIGGTMNPDGYIDAILGPLGYRIMLECKSSGAPMHHPDIYEAGKFVATYNAQGALIIAPSYAGGKVILWRVQNPQRQRLDRRRPHPRPRTRPHRLRAAQRLRTGLRGRAYCGSGMGALPRRAQTARRHLQCNSRSRLASPDDGCELRLAEHRARAHRRRRATAGRRTLPFDRRATPMHPRRDPQRLRVPHESTR
jgi:hypothetical protein